MDRIMSRPIRVSASFQTFAVRMLLYSAEVTSKGIFLQGVKSGGGLYLIESIFTESTALNEYMRCLGNPQSPI